MTTGSRPAALDNRPAALDHGTTGPPALDHGTTRLSALDHRTTGPRPLTTGPPALGPRPHDHRLSALDHRHSELGTRRDQHRHSDVQKANTPKTSPTQKKPTALAMLDTLPSLKSGPNESSTRHIATHVDTQHAALTEHAFTDQETLIKAVVQETTAKLQHEPLVVVFNKQCHQPRNVGFFSDDARGYTYSRQTMTAQPLTPATAQLLALVNDTFGARYNGILVNEYKDGTKHLGAHADSEHGLDPCAGVVSLSWGAERNLRIRDKRTKHILHNVAARHLHALQMQGDFQEHYLHEIPVQRQVQHPRVSITFRRHQATHTQPTQRKRKLQDA